jgi:hypothetical protein
MDKSVDPSLARENELQTDPHFPDMEALYRAAQPDAESEPDQPTQNELADETPNTDTNEEDERVHDSNGDYIVKLINERKALRHEADQLRIDALNLAIQWGVLDLFPELKKWLADAQRQGLLNPTASPDTVQTKEEIIDKIGAMESQATQNDHNADALTPEIMRDVPKRPSNAS